MARAKYQVLVIPYHIENGNVKYCIFKRNDMKVWQFIAGGGEDEDETIIISAKREAYEEANIDMDCKYSVLDTQNSIPTYCFKEASDTFSIISRIGIIPYFLRSSDIIAIPFSIASAGLFI